MSFIQNFFTSRDNQTDGNTYVGQEGRLWYNPLTNSIYVNTANIAGGTPVALATGSNIVANIITVNTLTSTTGNITVTGNLVISGNISPAAEGKIGGIYPGPGVVISNQGELTIDAANLPLSFGNFAASNNVLSIVNVDEDMILQTEGNAEIQLVGNIGFYKPDGIPPNVANRYFYATSDGTVNSKYLDIQSFGDTGIAAPFNVTIDSTGNYRAPAVLTGTIAQFTGNSGQRSFVVQDNYGIDSISSNTGGEYTFRTGRGTVDTPTAVQADDRLASIVATGWASNGYGGQASGYYRIVANENFTPTARGGRLEMWVVPNGTITETKIATINSTGLLITGIVSTTGNITGANVNTVNISLTGNVIGNVVTAGLVSATGNITGGNVLTGGLITATGNITTANTFVGNVAGLLTRRVRDAGTIADGGTLTIDFATDDLVYCVWNNGMTIAGSNYTAGRVIKVMARKGTGSGTDAITFNGFTAAQTSTGTTTSSYSADVTAIIEFISTNTAVGGVYIKL